MIMRIFLALGLVSILAGCNSLGGVPQFTSTAIAPGGLHPGDTALITIEVKDKNQIIHSIAGRVKEEPDLKLTLHNDGQEGDVTAGDNIWSLAVQVPVNAPPGAFNLTFTAYRSDGIGVPVRGEDGEISTLSVDMPLVISYKQ